MTKEECHLWFDFLRGYPVKILRQKIIANYIVDFYCEKARLAIELDGSQHYEPVGREKDEQRTKDIESFGVKVIRFTNRDIHERFDGVKEAIHQQIQARLAATTTAKGIGKEQQPTTVKAVPRPSKGGQKDRAKRKQPTTAKAVPRPSKGGLGGQQMFV
jgi:very-short-patch-repair endonuclease